MHRAPSEHERGTDQHRIPQPRSDGDGLGFVGRGTVGGLRNIQLLEHRREEFPVFGHLDVLRGCSNDRDAVRLQSKRQIERGLASELRDCPVALLPFVDVQDILQGQRFEIKFVARVVIGRDRLRIGVDHDGLEPVLLEGKRGMHAAVVKFNALADPVRSAAQDHDLAFGGWRGLVVPTIIGRVEIRRVGLKFGGTRIHKSEAGDQPGLFTLRAHRVLGRSGEVRDLFIRKTVRFCLGEQFPIHSSKSDFESKRSDVTRPVRECRVSIDPNGPRGRRRCARETASGLPRKRRGAMVPAFP